MRQLNSLGPDDKEQRVVSPGHLYELENFEVNLNDQYQTIRFIEKVPATDDPTKLVTVMNGTTNEEVLKVLIHRMGVINGKFPCRENSLAITKMDEALMWLEERTRKRLARGVEGQHKA